MNRKRDQWQRKRRYFEWKRCLLRNFFRLCFFTFFPTHSFVIPFESSPFFLPLVSSPKVCSSDPQEGMSRLCRHMILPSPRVTGMFVTMKRSKEMHTISLSLWWWKRSRDPRGTWGSIPNKTSNCQSILVPGVDAHHHHRFCCPRLEREKKRIQMLFLRDHHHLHLRWKNGEKERTWRTKSLSFPSVPPLYFPFFLHVSCGFLPPKNLYIPESASQSSFSLMS